MRKGVPRENHHLAQRRITYLLRRALGDLFLGPYSAYFRLQPAGVPLSLVPHLLIKRGQQDIAQQRRHDSSLRSSSWSFVTATLVFIARFQHLLDKDQHSAVGDLLSDKCH